MRLLRIDPSTSEHFTLNLEQFEGEHQIPYAIISHVWKEEEVLYTDATSCNAAHLKGFNKIKSAAEKAQDHNLKYIWMDTCCIDKSSSAELSEAINSMYVWYQEATICYAYLADVSADTDHEAENSEFSCSEWFTRGWCLQELLAPCNVIFYAKDWKQIGSKRKLSSTIARITGIDDEVLNGKRSLESISVAQRMSWAANRKTTRLEDVAYCLMGIFDVNMPMLYGEGRKAFRRLQEQIMRQSDDQSLFAWVDHTIRDDQLHGLLADSPAAFADSSKIFPFREWEARSPFDLSNRGLRIELYLIPKSADTFTAILPCSASNGSKKTNAAILVRKLQSRVDQYARIQCSKLESLSMREKGGLTTLYVPQRIPRRDEVAVYPTQPRCFHLQTTPYFTLDVEYVPLPPADLAKLMDEFIESSSYKTSHRYPPFIQVVSGYCTISAAILFRRMFSGRSFIIMLGTINLNDIGCNVIETLEDELGDLQSLQPHYDPQPIGTSLPLDNDMLSVDVKTQSVQGTILYILNITTNPIKKQRTLSEVQREALLEIEPDPNG